MANVAFDTFLPFGQLFSLFRSGVKGAYRFGYNILHTSTQFNAYHNDKEKLVSILSSPAALKVFALQCDLFSLGKLYVYDEDENEIEGDPFLDMMKRPNPFQTQSQMLWDFMFWNMLGTAYCYVDSKLMERNKLYFLDPSKLEWPRELERAKDKLVFSDATIKEREKMTVTYRYDDGSAFQFPLHKLIISTDLTNGLGNWYKGPSRIDALYKIISNSEHALDSKNINLRYSGKFLVGSQNDTTKIGLGDTEKKDIEDKVDDDSGKKVWALKTMIQIRRFVDDFKSLELGKSYLEDYFLIGSMYGIPRDVLEAYNSATYENQEKARAAHVNYCFDPKGNQFMNSFETFFGYDQRNICMSWDHLPFMQVFEKERVEVKAATIKAFKELIAMGVSVDQANAYMDTDFQPEEKPENETTDENQDGNTESGSGSAEGEQEGETEDTEQQ